MSKRLRLHYRPNPRPHLTDTLAPGQLGHRDITTTQRYAHLTQASLIEAASSVPWQPVASEEKQETDDSSDEGMTGSGG